MAYDYRINAEAPKAGIDAFQAGQRIGGGFGRLAGKAVDTYNKGKQEEQDLVKKQKIDALVMKFNNPNSPEFQGLSPKQRSLRLSRLLIPLDEAMSSRYEQQARNIDEKTSLFKQQQKIKEMGNSASEKNKFNAKLGALFSKVNDKATWDAERKRYQEGKTGLFIPEWESATRQAWIDNAIKLGTKTETPVAIKSSDLAREGASALDAGTYKKWYDKKIAGTDAENYIAKPISDESGNLSNVGTISKSLQSLKEGKLGGSTFGSKVTQAREAGAEAGVGLDQLGIDKNTKYYKGIPKRLESFVTRQDDNFETRTADAVDASNKAKRLKKIIGSKDQQIKGATAVTAVFDFLKALDPRSVVREGEFNMMESIGGLIGRLETADEKLGSGVVLPASVVKDMRKVLDIIDKEAELRVDKEALDTANRLIDRRINPDEVLPASIYQRVKKKGSMGKVGQSGRTDKELGY